MSYRQEAESHRTLYFDHLGARQVPTGVEIWLTLRQESGESVRILSRWAQDEVVPSVSDLWAGAEWCEREAAEALAISFSTPTPLLLLAHEEERGYLHKDQRLSARLRSWPGGFDPAGKTIKPLGAE